MNLSDYRQWAIATPQGADDALDREDRHAEAEDAGSQAKEAVEVCEHADNNVRNCQDKALVQVVMGERVIFVTDNKSGNPEYSAQIAENCGDLVFLLGVHCDVPPCGRRRCCCSSVAESIITQPDETTRRDGLEVDEKEL